MFICNHCPCVKAVRERLVLPASSGNRHRVDRHHVERSGGLRRGFVREHGSASRAEFRFPFPYVLDETQDIARAHGAVCTPDFFGFSAGLELQYRRGRLDASRKDTAPERAATCSRPCRR
ncbi:MAG: hypothetical protein U1E63_01665 [Burkholderiales bacterium]